MVDTKEVNRVLLAGEWIEVVTGTFFTSRFEFEGENHGCEIAPVAGFIFNAAVDNHYVSGPITSIQAIEEWDV